jgi:hypothetical protein
MTRSLPLVEMTVRITRTAIYWRPWQYFVIKGEIYCICNTLSRAHSDMLVPTAVFWRSTGIYWLPQQYFGLRQEYFVILHQNIGLDSSFFDFDSDILASAVRFGHHTVVFWRPQ